MTRPDEAIRWLYGRQRLGMTLGLERIRDLLAEVGQPQKSFRTVLVAGTNGKGSTARALSEILAEAGERVAVYTSPHLSRIGERFVVSGSELSREAVGSAVQRLRPAAERLGASFFEILTAAACLLFSEENVAIGVMEVGLGGRFDATNALEPELSIVTGVSRDHVELLGNGIRDIAGEKAGILRAGRLALTAARGEALEVVRERAGELGAPLWVMGEEIEAEGEGLGWQGVRVRVDCPAGVAEGRSPLVGMHQVRNLALAAAAGLGLGASPQSVGRGLARTRWPGRLERVPHRGRWLVFDGAHNVESAEALAEALAGLLDRPYTLVVGVGRDKDLTAMARVLGRGAGRVIATRARYSPRARPADEVAAAFSRQTPAEAGGEARHGLPTEAEGEPGRALRTALAGTIEGGTVVVAGSLYLVGELRSLVLAEPFEAEERWQ
jgi:dihydrofolate synthase/folylpolyglutamate synthase